jgi:hypothetical protein
MLTLRADNDRVNQAAPASNPGSDDPSAGIATGSGGVSSAAYVLSPVPSEQKSVVQSTVDAATTAVETVRSYLPSLASLSLGGGKTEEAESSNAGGEEEAVAAGGAAPVTTAAASTAAATTERDTAPTDSADQTATATAKDEAMADSDPKDDVTKTDKANEEAKAQDHEKSSDVANTDRDNEESKAKEDTEAPKPGVGNEGSEVKSDESPEPKKERTGAKENRDAIPTAGGERLGDKHWGESKIVPDAPPKRDSEAGPQVSSAEGQPDSMFLHIDLELVLLA